MNRHAGFGQMRRVENAAHHSPRRSNSIRLAFLVLLWLCAAWWSGGCVQSIPATHVPVPPAHAFADPLRSQPTPHLDWPGTVTVIGKSHEGRLLEGYTTGDGPIHVVFVGGIHGGYEWNSILLAHQFLDRVTRLPDLLPDAFTVTVIPVANPDGMAKVIGHSGRFTAAAVTGATTPGRFNANNVDLNRNWECHWSATATWRNVTVSGGSAPFSEPETRALRDFFLSTRPDAVIFWHSAAPGVFAGGCDEPFAASRELARVYGIAAGYPSAASFDAYPVTGDAGDWLATQEIPSITVELTNRTDTDFVQNMRGVLAVLDYLRQGS